jgi:integrase
LLLPVLSQYNKTMKAKVLLLARVPDGQGGYPFKTVSIKRGRPVPVDDATAYYLRYSIGGRRIVKAVGADLDAAYVAFQNTELNHERIRQGLHPVEGPASLLDDFRRHVPDRIRIKDAVAQYVQRLEDSVKTGERTTATKAGYKLAVEDFSENCGVEFLDEITGDVLRRHKLWLFENIEKRVRGKLSNTVAKRFRYLNAFFNTQGITMLKSSVPRKGDEGLIARNEIPREEKKPNIDKYSEEEIKAMLSVADEDEKDLIHTFLRTGCRDEEVVYLHWTDVDWKRKQITISEKPKYGWRTKDKESRDLPLEDGILLDRLTERRKRQKPASNLVFPNTLGEPDKHLILKLHKVVKKAKAAGHEFEGAITLHRFRRTYASMLISHCDLQTVSALLGHSDIQTTSRYLATDQSKARIGTRTAFAGVDK